MRILLVAPGAKTGRMAKLGNLLGMNLHPKYGLLLLGSQALEMGIDVRYVDESFEPLPAGESFDLVGVTCITSKAARAYEITEHFRRRGIPTVLGGVHASACPEEARRYADSVVIGEADKLWPQVLSDTRAGNLKPLYSSTEPPSGLANITQINYGLIPESYNYRHRSVVEASRGCPNSCEFCSTRYFGKGYRLRPVDEVLSAIDSAPDDYIVFMDDNLTGDKAYALELFSRMRGIGKSWMGHATVDIALHPDLLRAFADSGCRNLAIGFDTMDLNNLKISGKAVNFRIDYAEAVNRIHDAGIDIIASFILGFDMDDERSFERIYDFAISQKIYLPTYWILTPYPGTRLRKRLEKEGRILGFDWDKYDNRHLVFEPRSIPYAKFMKCFEWLEKHTFSWQGIFSRARRSSDKPFNRNRKLKFNAALKLARATGMVNYGE